MTLADIFWITRDAVGKSVKAYRQGGDKALKAKTRYGPKGGSLRPWQAAQVAKTVVNRHAEQLKLPFYIWTREALGQFIEKRFGIRVSIWTVGRYLERCGFIPQKPVRQAFEKNAETVRRWLEEDYPGIQRKARVEKARTYWGDEMGMRSLITL
jgi:transposase